MKTRLIPREQEPASDRERAYRTSMLGRPIVLASTCRLSVHLCRAMSRTALA